MPPSLGDTAKNEHDSAPPLARTKRWSEPFGDMSPGDISDVLETDLFRRLCPDPESARKVLFESFGTSVSIYGIIENDTCIHTCEKGEIIIRKGSYGSSAFYLIDGELNCIFSPDLPPSVLGHRDSQKDGVFTSIAKNVKTFLAPSAPEYNLPTKGNDDFTNSKAILPEPYFTDIHSKDKYEFVPINANTIFGEVGAIYRTPRSATVIASTKCKVLEIRWQGLRDIMEADDEMSEHVNNLYRERTLEGTLTRDPLFKDIPADQYNLVTFQAYGKFDEWSSDYIEFSPEEKQAAIEQEEVISKQGEYVDGVYIVRSGFARVCTRYGKGYKTLSYIGSGRIFGLAEAMNNWKNPNDLIPRQSGLRAIGYAHVLHIPTLLMEKYVLPNIEENPNITRENLNVTINNMDRKDNLVPQNDVFEFLAQNRFMNGTKTMVIDANKCTRCDDCVRACASAHDGNPRFQRHGPITGHYMVVNACMHCADPVCMIGCPTGAISRENLGGEVVINDNTCIGCSICYNNCPYDAIRMVTVRDKKGFFKITASGDNQGAPIYKATKCDFCVDHRGGPACVRACPHDALARIDMQNTKSIKTFVTK